MKLSDDRKRQLETQFRGVPDHDLIQELLRRERFHRIEANALYWPELREEGGYMDNIRECALRRVAQMLADSKMRPALITERPYPIAAHNIDFKLPMSEGIPSDRQGVLTADVIVLCARDKKEG